ncbi:hypothetical protein MKX03_001074, partial [Papaver bracteatum]
TWGLYERGELVMLVDTAMDGDFDAEEACKFLKISLLCTQDSPKLRPSMSTVVKMLTGEVAMNNDITKPGLISDFMDLKVKSNDDKPSTYNTVSSGSDQNDHSMSSGNTTSCATITFTDISYRS